MFTHFVANSEKCCKYAFLGGPPRLLRYYIGGVIEIYYNTTKGGGESSRFITILQGGGVVSQDPKFVLRNIWTAPKRNTGWKWLSLKIWQGNSYFLWKDEHTKVIIFENMTPKKPIHLKRWPCKRYYLFKSWDSQINYFWKDDRVKVIIEGKGLKRCGTTSGPTQKYCKLVLIWYSVDINHTQGWDQYTKTVLSWI